jgi:ceramide glucosyltransferase
MHFAPEILTSSVLTLLAAAIAAPEWGLRPAAGVWLAALVWYGAEAALAFVAGWPLGPLSPLAWLVRDLILPWLWVQGWVGDRFEWRGNAMTVGEDDLAPDAAGPFAPSP